jgi:hypothetical protein
LPRFSVFLDVSHDVSTLLGHSRRFSMVFGRSRSRLGVSFATLGVTHAFKPLPEFSFVSSDLNGLGVNDIPEEGLEGLTGVVEGHVYLWVWMSVRIVCAGGFVFDGSMKTVQSSMALKVRRRRDDKPWQEQAEGQSFEEISGDVREGTKTKSVRSAVG